MSRAAAIRILAEAPGPNVGFAADRIHQTCQREQLRKRERKFLTELVLGTLRHKLTLDCIIRAYSKVRWKDLERRVLAGLRLGVYQLLYLDGVPSFAAIHETVAVFRRNERQRRFLNGVLRTIDREVRRVPLDQDRGGASPRKRLLIRSDKVCFFSKDVFADPADLVTYLSETLSHPRLLVERWNQQFGPERAEKLLRLNNQPPPLFLRSNALRGSRDEILARLHSEKVRATAGHCPESILVHVPVSEVLASKCFRDGAVTIQDETAMRVAPQVDARSSDRILDLCAAPGGKATHLAELTGDRASIVAVDRGEERVQRIRNAQSRLGLKSIATVDLDLLQASESDLQSLLGGGFERILLDAPCSNTGVLRRRPEARYRLEEAVLRSLVDSQRSLLQRAGQLLGPAGRLVYSTCSLEPEENQQQVQAFLQANPRYELRREVLTVPSADEGDGGYFAVFEPTQT